MPLELHYVLMPAAAFVRLRKDEDEMRWTQDRTATHQLKMWRRQVIGFHTSRNTAEPGRTDRSQEKAIWIQLGTKGLEKEMSGMHPIFISTQVSIARSLYNYTTRDNKME